MTEYRKITRKFMDISLLRRINLQKASNEGGLYMGQFPIIEFISKNDGCTQCEIAQSLKVSPASIALSTKRLQKMGLISKKTDKKNLRKNMLSVTEKGKEAMEKTLEAFKNTDKIAFASFSDEELQTLCGFLDRIILNLNENQPFEPDKIEAFIMDNEIKKKNSIRGDDK